MFWFVGSEVCGILIPWPGIKLESPAIEGEVLTIGPPGKYHENSILRMFYTS